MKRIFFLLLLCGLAFGQNNKVIKELLVIGDKETASPEYLLGAPEHLCTDSKQNIFVYDRSIGRIRNYNREGKFIKNIGRKGKGPGEFVDIDAMLINSGDTLIIFDTQGSRITYFSSSGNYLSSQKMDYSEMMWPRDIKEFGTHYYVLSFLKENSPNNIHITDRKFNIKYSLGRNEFKDISKNKVTWLIESFTGGSVACGKSNLLYAPYAYDGKIYRISTENNSRKIEILKSKVNRNEPFELVNAKGDYKPEDRPYSMRIYDRSDQHALKFNNESRGLFYLKDGSIIHFTLIKSGKERVFGYEIYDKKGTLTSYKELYKKKIIDDKPAEIPIFVECKDSEDNFYLIDRTALPVIKKVRLN